MTKKELLQQHLAKKHRFTLQNLAEAEENKTVDIILSNKQLYGIGGISFFVLLCLTSFLILVTPLKTYLLGYGSPAIRKQVADLYEQSDSLMILVDQQHQFITNIQGIITDDKLENRSNVPLPSLSDTVTETTATLDSTAINLNYISDAELNLRNSIEKNNTIQNIDSIVVADNKVALEQDSMILLAPVDGYVTSSFDPTIEHLGIDVVAAENSPIRAIANGMVILAAFTTKTGHIIAIQHPDNLVSFYKHNSKLLKEVGDVVHKGDEIAIIGATGETSTGIHLHFELWHQQVPVDPTTYISFK